MNITFSPMESNCLRFPDRKPSPSPTSSSRDPTPHAIPNIVRKERNLCAHKVRRVWPKISKMRRTAGLCDYTRSPGLQAGWNPARSRITGTYTLPPEVIERVPARISIKEQNDGRRPLLLPNFSKSEKLCHSLHKFISPNPGLGYSLAG